MTIIISGDTGVPVSPVTGTLAVANGGTGVTAASTGTGGVVLSASPTITTPTISSLSSASATALTLQSAGTTAITINTSQNVGIGTSSPLAKLNVVQTFGNSFAASLNVSAAGTAQSQLAGMYFSPTFVGTGDNGTRRAADIWAGFNGGNWGTQYLAFGVGNAQNDVGDATPERMRIDSSGNVLVGCTAVPNVGATPDQFGFSVSSSEVVISKSTSGTTPATYIKTIAGASKTPIVFYNGINAPGSITTTPTATAYNTSSDYRLKENIVLMTGALNKVAKLKPVTYTWKADGSSSEGFIAHELQAIVPDCVTGEKDAVDAEGNPQYQGIDTSFLVATLTAAIQEQQTIINDLKARIETLEAK